MNNLSYQLYHILAGAWRQRKVIVIPIILLPIIGGIVSITSGKHYRAHTSMLIQETAKLNPFLEDLAVSTMLKDRMAALNTLLHSRHILRAVAVERGLITEEMSDSAKDNVIADLSGRLSMTMAGKDLINISLTSHTPIGMKETLEEVSRQFVEQLLAPERSSIRDSAYFLEQHLNQRREELDLAENALADYRNQHAFALPDMHANNITRLSQLKDQLAEKQAELAGKKRSLGGINQQLTATNPVIGRLEEQIIKTRSELALLKSRYTEKHSKVLAMTRKLSRLENERQAVLNSKQDSINLQQLWDIASNTGTTAGQKQQPLLISQLDALQKTQTKVEALEEEVGCLSKLIKELEPNIAAFGKHQHQLKKLERDLIVKRELYEDLLQRYEMAQVTGSLSKFEENKRIKVIDRPYTPSSPANLPLLLFVVGGLFGGIFFGAGLGLVFEVTDTSIRRKDVLENLTELPVLTRLPKMV